MRECPLRCAWNQLFLCSFRMQFSHTSDMANEEILDYAILYGNEISNLTIKSFNNFIVRDFEQDEWISIFIDLMVCILDFENPLQLRNHHSTKELFDPIDQILFRWVKLLCTLLHNFFNFWNLFIQLEMQLSTWFTIHPRNIAYRVGQCFLTLLRRKLKNMVSIVRITVSKKKSQRDYYPAQVLKSAQNYFNRKKLSRSTWLKPMTNQSREMDLIATLGKY